MIIILRAEFLARLRFICRCEQLTIDQGTLEMMIESTGGDFRQILNQLQILSTIIAEHKETPPSSEKLKAVVKTFSKDQLLGISPFDAAKSILVETRQKSMITRYDMFFSDYEMTPMIVEQNYLDSIKSNGMSLQTVNQMAEAADAICDMEHVHEYMLKHNVG